MTHGMVCAAQPEAVEAGLEVLKAGGNALDAAIGCALVQTAVDPQMCGIAGFGSLHLLMPKRKVHTVLDFYGRAPLATKPDMWAGIVVGEATDGFGFILEGRKNELGYGSLTTPMALQAWGEALGKYGTMPLGQLMEPAIRYCEDGFMIRPAVHSYWATPSQNGRVAHRHLLLDCPATRRIYAGASGELKPVGDILRNPDMGRTYRRIAQLGVEDFYQGGIAREIDADMKANGGLITLADLRSCKTDEGGPLWGTYRGCKVAVNPPPGGGVILMLMLNILECFDLRALGHNSPQYIAVVSEAMKIATVDKDTRMNDPKFAAVPVEELMSKPYAAKMAERIKRGEKTHVQRLNPGRISPDTTHVSVVDEHGNCVAMTHSLGSASGVVTEGLGFMYNNCMAAFDPRPGRAWSLAPGKARFSAMCPTILFKDDKPFLVIGAPGGTYITMGVLQAILNAVDFDMNALEAVSAARFCTTSDTIDLTNRVLRSTEARLNAMGYPTNRWPLSYYFAGVHAIRIKDGKLDGGADPGRDGMAMAV